MKRFYTALISFVLCIMTINAQEINMTFKETNLPDILKSIDKKMKGGHIQFLFDDLDGIIVSRTFVNLTPIEAVRKAIGAYPIKITEDEGDIYVEYDKSIIKDVVLSNVTVFGNSEMVNTLNYMRKAMNFSVNFPQEKVYLHLDNTGYFMNEDLFFKAYVINAATQMRTELSQTLYVELVNPEGEVVKTEKLLIKDGEADGSMKLDKLYTSGFYEVRAYTRYMLNWGNSTVFSRVIPIFREPKVEGDYSKLVIDEFSHKKRRVSYREASEDLESPVKFRSSDNLLTTKRLPKGEINVHFYPEGGHLVEDLSSRVAFTVVDDEGMDFDCTGYIVDSRGHQFASFETFSQGRGYFVYTPSLDEKAYMRITTTDGKHKDFPLPEPEFEGVSLSVNTLRDDYVTARITSSPSLRNHLLGYVLMNQGRIVTCDTVTCRKDVLIKYERKGLPAGVNQLTVFDDAGHILADRLFFVCPKKDASKQIKVSTDQQAVIPCGKVSLKLHATPNSTISLSAMDAASLPNGAEGNAQTWMLLSSDLKGYIANPDYYFESDDREHRLNADLLMLVQGWRRYDWSLMIGESDFAHLYPIEDNLYIDGKVMKKNGNTPADSVTLNVYLYSDSVSLSGTTTTDSLGNYAFQAPDMGGEWHLVFVTKNGDEPLRTRVGVNRNFSPQARYLSPYETRQLSPLKPNLFDNVPDSVYDRFEAPVLLRRERVLPEVKVKAKRRIYDNARAAWESETVGQYYSSSYYDIDREVENIYDRGDKIPTFQEWIYSRNPFFTGTGADRFIPKKEKSNIVSKNDPSISHDFEDKARIWSPEAQFAEKGWTLNKRGEQKQKLVYSSASNRDHIYHGMSYKHRPIVWILNNGFYGVEDESIIKFDSRVLKQTVDEFPIGLDEVKSVYISEDSRAYEQFLVSSDLSVRSPVTIFVYTHHNVKDVWAGQRHTYFKAYSEPTTFQMNDYSKLPPMEDFRRTIFWAPTVKTDANGNATVNFYNNSSCRRMYISAEGLDKQGRVLVQ